MDYKFEQIYTSSLWENGDSPRTFALMADGNYYATGRNEDGQLTLTNQDHEAVCEFTPIIFDKKIRKAVCHDSRNMFLITTNNELYATGVNRYGELGAGHTNFVYKYTKVFENVKNVYSNELNTFIITNDNEIYCAGSNNFGQLGLGDGVNRTVFTKINTDFVDVSKIKKIEIAYGTVYIFTEDGELYGAGRYGTGQFAMTAASNAQATTFIKISTPETFIDISAGSVHLYALAENGNMYVTGYNYYGQLGLNNTTNQYAFKLAKTGVSCIACTQTSGHYMTTDGKVYGAGWTYHGVLGINVSSSVAYKNFKTAVNITNAECFYSIGGMNLIIKTKDNKLYGCGLNSYNLLGCAGGTIDGNNKKIVYTELNLPCSIDELEYIDIGMYSSVIKTKSGEFFLSGDNEYGQLGYVSQNYRSFTKIPFNNIKELQLGFENYGTFILTDNGELYTCGYNNYGELGFTTYSAKTEATSIASDVKRFFTSEANTFIIKNDNTFYGCGTNYKGQLGLPLNDDDYLKTTFQLLEPEFDVGTIVDIKISDGFTTVLLKNGDVYACGANGSGQMGVGHKDPIIGFTLLDTNVKEVINHEGSLFLIKNNGNIYVSGWNDYSQLGIVYTEEVDNIITRTQLTISEFDMLQIKKIYHHVMRTFFLLENGDLYACGKNQYGQVGAGTFETVHNITKIFENVESLVLGINHTMAITKSGELYACGKNDFGQLGLGHTNHVSVFTKVNININIDKLILAPEGSFIIDTEKNGYFCGDNIWGQTGCNIMQSKEHLFKVFTPYNNNSYISLKDKMNIVINNENVEIISGAIKASHEIMASKNYIYVKGSNEFGQLGTGDNEDRAEYTKVEIPNISLKEISSGNGHSVLIDSNGELYVTGKNDKGQLGNGTFTNLNAFTKNESVNNINHVKAIKDMTIIEIDNDIYYTDLNDPSFIKKE